MKGNQSKTGEEKTQDFLPQSFSFEEETEGEICKDDEYYLGIVDSYFYVKEPDSLIIQSTSAFDTQKGEKEVEA